MGCCGDREKDAVIKNDVKWEYVNLNDFKSSSCFTPLAYIYLWLMLFVSISVYAVDTFTAVNLIAFNRWAGQIKPSVPLKYTRWIFAGCIILSFVLLFYRWLRALKVMRGGKVAKSYLDPLAVRIECIRMGQGRGWKRFLVFAELTKSRKGADYVALFTYYSFEAWLRICFAEGPRTVVNGITLVAYAQAHFVPTGDHATPQGQSPFVQFWKNFAVLAESDKLQMAIIIGMLWTCFIWILSALSLAASVILYLIFLWHHIPSDAGGLTKYCRSKINRRMERIVKQKTDKALKKENEIRAREEAKAFREGTAFKRQPTLPDVAGATTLAPAPPPLSRQTTMSTLPEYTSRPGTAAPPESVPTLPVMPPLDTQSRPPPGPRRHQTNASDSSWTSYNSNAPLMHANAEVGYSPIDRLQTPSSGAPTPWSARPGPQARNFSEYTQYTDRSYTPGPQGPPRPGTSQSYRPNGDYPMAPLPRPGTGMSHRPGYQRQSSDSEMLPPIPRGMSPAYPQSATATQPPPFPDQRSRTPAQNQNNYNPYFPPVSPIPEYGGRESPAIMADQPVRSHTPMGPPPRSFTPGHQPPLPRHQTPTPFGADRYTPSPAPAGNGYVAFNPSAARTASPAPIPAPMPTSSPAPQNHTYQSYQNQPSSGADCQAQQRPGHVRQSSFSRPFSSQNGGYPPSQNNLQPPKPGPPQRAGSFDDILDHY